MATPPFKHRSLEPTPSGLVVIARDAHGKIVTRITSKRDLVGAMHTASCVLKLKKDAVRVEVHHAVHQSEDLSWEYRGRPLAVMSYEDLLEEQRRR